MSCIGTLSRRAANYYRVGIMVNLNRSYPQLTFDEVCQIETIEKIELFQRINNGLFTHAYTGHCQYVVPVYKKHSKRLFLFKNKPLLSKYMKKW